MTEMKIDQREQARQRREAERIRDAYAPQSESKLEALKKLNKKAERPAQIFALIFGIAGALVLGVGMCLAMKIIGDMMPLGIVIGCVGIVMVCANYFIYTKILSARKKKYAAQVISLSDELLNN